MADRLLIADDERDITDMLARFFRERGYDVLCAYTGVEAVRAVFAAGTAEEARDALPEGVTAVVVSLTAAEKQWDILENAPHGAVYRGEEAEGFFVAFENDDVIVYLAR